ncbi:akirin-like [Artemia franciscana]
MKQDEVMTNVCEEVKRLGRRKQLTYEAVTESGPSNSSIKHEPLLTIKQVITLCEKIIREREEQTRETYDEVLTAKLAEQYAAFVKFTFDQVRQRFETEHPSYLS